MYYLRVAAGVEEDNDPFEVTAAGSSQGLLALARGSAMVKNKLKLGKSGRRSKKEMVRGDIHVVPC